MEEQHERLFDLIESKSFEELTNEEKSFVLNHMTEAEYNLQRTIIAAVPALEYPDQEPLALELPKAKKHFLNRSVPLYQVLIGAACLILLFMVGNQKSYSLNWHFSEYPLEISVTGASSGKVIHDTIVKEIPVFRTASTIIRDTVTVVERVLQQPEQRILEVNKSLSYPELTEKLLETKSTPFREDQTAQFLPSSRVVNTLK
jgi:uncharacterized integral membrane protein